jgi:hypothetical protein
MLNNVEMFKILRCWAQITHLAFLRNLLSPTRDDTPRRRNVSEIDDYVNILLRIQQHFWSKKLQQVYLLYSQQANHMILKKVAEFIKLIKRFRILQVWLKSSDIRRWLSGLKSELFEAFSKVEVLMFFDKRALKVKSFLIKKVRREHCLFTCCTRSVQITWFQKKLRSLLSWSSAFEEHQNLNFWKSFKKLWFQIW